MEQKHFINNKNIFSPCPEEHEEIFLGMGCFWGAEKLFWELDFIYVTSVGYGGGKKDNPSYQDVCSGTTNHVELVKIIYLDKKNNLPSILKIFWESHDPTQGMRQGNDVGTQYRSVIYTTTIEQFNTAEKSFDIYNSEVNKKLGKKITTEIMSLPNFFYAEDYHQQYLAKNPEGYCGLNSLGIEFNQNDLLDV
ncbi:MAG: peptide-methionine (S)-S-oxide reductase [Gammaproteobacteria bacterium]|nr:peptide-methionine (S)-S-oxide reductase [Gammaproteobacteria bacterium]|tara:strand:- start:788 stop:1366 length:579 start_codon:yes stop_codon:yes gene_type:complete